MAITRPIQFVYILMALTICASVAAADVAPSGITAQIENVPGQPIRFLTSQGDEATLKGTSGDSSGALQGAFQITDNTCSNRQGMTCHYRYQLRHLSFGFIWTKHHDPTKLGSLVEVYEYGMFSGGFGVDWTGLDPHEFSRAPLLAKPLMSHEIVCDDFTWLPGGSATPPLSVHVARWSSERNKGNSETDVRENETDGDAYGIDFVRSGPHTLKVTGLESMDYGMRNSGVLPESPNSTLTMLGTNGEPCQVGFSSNMRNRLEINSEARSAQVTSQAMDVMAGDPIFAITPFAVFFLKDILGPIEKGDLR